MTRTQGLIDPRELGLQVFGLKDHEALCLCPYHDDHSPSAYFNVHSGLFYCFVCGTGKTAKQLATDLEGRIVRVSTILGSNIERVGSVLDWASLLSAPLAYDNPYLQGRNVTAKAIEEFDIRALEHGVLFPIRNQNGDIVGAQLRRYSGEPRYILIGERTAIWPLDKFFEKFGHRSPHVFAVEGAFGVVNAFQHGVEAYCMMGASSIQYGAYALRSMRQFKIWFDHDFAGYLGAARLLLKTDGRARVIVPGAETDEIDQERWDDACQSQGSANLLVLSEMSGNPGKFSQLIRKDLF